MHLNVIARSVGATCLLSAMLPLAGQADERKRLAFEVIDRNAQPMTDISDSLYYFGELGMQEFESTKLLKETLEAGGFKVELGGAGMPTNLWAEWGAKDPIVRLEKLMLERGWVKQAELDRERAKLREQYGDRSTEASAKRDQALAILFWAAKENKSRQ